MARAQYYCASSLDGYIADENDGIGWLTGWEGTYAGGAGPVREAMEALNESIGSMVMGSATYEFLLNEVSQWPYGDKPAWVLTSRSLPRIEGASLQFHEGDVGEIYDEMNEAAGEGILWVVGGGPVASQFADLGLLDELWVTIVPVVLGSGKRLFERPPRDKLQLQGTKAFDNGMVELRYEFLKGG